MDEVKRVDRELYFIFRFIPPFHLYPVNCQKEKEKVFEDKTYNPKFRYSRTIISEKVKSRLRNLKINLRRWNKLFSDKKKEFIDKIRLTEAIGSNRFPSLSYGLWGVPSRELISKANRLLKLPVTKNSLKYSQISTVKRFLENLLEQGYRWQIKERDLVVGALTNNSKRILYINKNRKFDDVSVKRLIAHEISTHIARSEKGRNQLYRLFWMGFPGYLRTEEGLAVYNEEKAGVLTNNVWRHYAGRVIAIALGCKNSFSTVYTELLEFFSKNTAWNLTLRAKRGLGDTSRPGAYSKDIVYLDGYYQVKDFVARGGNLKDLYLGRIGIQHIKTAKEMLGKI